MKRMEVVMKSSAFDRFRESATRLGISEYDVSDVRLSPGFAAEERRRFYRGQEYNLDLLARVKVEFAVYDEDAKPVAQNLLTLVAPDSIAIFALDEVISISTSAVHRESLPRTEHSASEMMGIGHWAANLVSDFGGIFFGYAARNMSTNPLKTTMVETGLNPRVRS